MSRPVRVGFVVHALPAAGAAVPVREIISRLGPAITPTVFCLDRVGAGGEQLQAAGADIVCFDLKPGWDYSVGRRLVAEASRRRIEVLHAYGYAPFVFAALAKPLCRPVPRLILTEHGRPFPDVVSTKRAAVNRLLLDRLADAVTAGGQFGARSLTRTDGFRGGRIRVIPTGIDVDQFGPATDQAAHKKSLGFDPDRRYVVHVARYHPAEDQAMLLRGFAAAAEHHPDLDLLMAGDGPLRGELEALAESLGLGQRAKFLGVRDDVPVVLQAADVFALTGVSEAASHTMLEAMATGLPSVVSAAGCDAEVVRDGRDGLHFPRGDWAACGRALRDLLDDPDRAYFLGQSAMRRAREQYRLEDTVAAYRTLYRRLAGR